MSHYITIRVTLSQAEALENAADIISDGYEADGRKGEARRYRLASERVTAALQNWARSNPARAVRYSEVSAVERK